MVNEWRREFFDTAQICVCVVVGDDKQTEAHKKVYIFLPSFLSFLMCSLIRLSPGQIWQLILNCLEDNSKGQRKQTVGKMHLSSIPLLSLEIDNNTCWRGLISLKCWKAQATSTIAPLVFHLFSARTSVLGWPPTLSLPLQFCPVRTRLSPDAWVMVYWPSTWGDKHLQRNSSCLEW